MQCTEHIAPNTFAVSAVSDHFDLLHFQRGEADVFSNQCKFCEGGSTLGWDLRRHLQQSSSKNVKEIQRDDTREVSNQKP